jgi:hypothetical protein
MTARDECNKKKLTLRKAEEGASPLTWAWAAMVDAGGSAWGISLVTQDKMEVSPTGVSAYLSTRAKQETDEGNRSCSMTTRTGGVRGREGGVPAGSPARRAAYQSGPERNARLNQSQSINQFACASPPGIWAGSGKRRGARDLCDRSERLSRIKA